MKLILFLRYLVRLIYPALINITANVTISFGARVALSTRIYAENGSDISIDSATVIERHGNVQAFNNSRVRICSNIFVNKNFSCVSRAGIYIGENTIIGPNVNIYDHNHKLEIGFRKNEYRSSQIIIERDVWIGANATILKGVTVGAGAIIPANAVVRHNVMSNTIYAET